MTIPVLETERLTLRQMTRADFPAYFGVLRSDRSQYMGGPYDDKVAWHYFASDLGSWLLDRFGYWTAVAKGTDAPVAFTGIAHPPNFPEQELGWFTTAEAEGKGYAHEAASAALGWAFASRGLSTLVSYIDRDNTRSIALAERLGATHDPKAKAPFPEDLVYRHPNPKVAA